MRDANDIVNIQETPRMHQFHFVQKGETLKEIANKYHMSLQELSHINQINSSSMLHKGQRLHVHKRGFDHHEMIPLVKETDKKNAYTDYNVDQKRTASSKNSDQKIRKYLLLPFVGLGALGAGVWALTRKAAHIPPKIKVDGIGVPSSNASMPELDNININNGSEVPKAAVGTNPRPPSQGPNGESISELEDLGFDIFQAGIGLLGGSTTLGLGLAGLNKLLQTNNKDRIAHASLDDYCARIAFGWPLNYQKRVFRYADPQYKEAGIWIENTKRELYVTPAFPGQIIDIQKPSRSEESMYNCCQTINATISQQFMAI